MAKFTVTFDIFLHTCKAIVSNTTGLAVEYSNGNSLVVFTKKNKLYLGCITFDQDSYEVVYHSGAFEMDSFSELLRTLKKNHECFLSK